MPVVTEDKVAAFAHCTDARCYGYKQEPVEGIRTTTGYTNTELGGPGAVAGGHIERSSESVRFADESTDGTCPVCDGPRGISEQTRPEYAHQSGQAQDALLHLGRTDAEVKDLKHASEVSELKREQEMQELRRQVDALTSALKGQEPKRGPGRPRKTEGDE